MLPSRFVRWMLISLALVLAFAPFATASAQGRPTRIPWPFEPWTSRGVCTGFDVYWGKTADKGYMTIFTEKDASRYVITGVLKLTPTNTTTGKSISVVNSAQATEVDYADGSWTFDVYGPSTWVQSPGLPALAYVKGHVSVTGDANGILTFQHTGYVQDLCAALAP